jgi:molybdate transport system regulatory protein
MKRPAQVEYAIMPRIRVTVGEEVPLGPGKAQLLALIHQTGSITKAARAMGMSYMRAWTLIQTMNACFREPLVMTSKGGKKGGGGAHLTETGREALVLYEGMIRKCLRALQPDWDRLQKLLSA